MSLINEALKRARVEAARRDAAAKGVPAAALPIYVPRRQPPWLAPVAGFAAGLVAVAMAAGAFWLVRRPATAAGDGVASVVATSGAVTEPLPQVAAPPSLTQVAAPRPARDPSPDQRPVNRPIASSERPSESRPNDRRASTSQPAAPPVVPPPVTPPPEVSPPAVAPSASRPPRSVAVTPAASAPAASAPVAAPALPPEASPPDAGGIRTYLRQAAPAGGSVKVDFIVWSESQPFAQINGELLSSGQSIDGYTLLVVERERVQLEGGGERFWLRVK